MHGLICRQIVMDVGAHDDTWPREAWIDDDICAGVWADVVYLSAKNEAWLKESGQNRRIHRKKSRGFSMSADLRA